MSNPYSPKKIKTSELVGPELDWAVAVAYNVEIEDDNTPIWFSDDGPRVVFTPSTDWAQGGPIIDREIGNVWKHNKVDPNQADVWTAASYRKAPDGTAIYYEEGPTALIAAMRCYVASKLGDEVEVPKGL